MEDEIVCIDFSERVFHQILIPYAAQSANTLLLLAVFFSHQSFAFLKPQHLTVVLI